jgi:hypothetical protein
MGRAVAEILFGKRNPCGKLTVTVPETLEETPAWLHYPGKTCVIITEKGCLSAIAIMINAA